MVNANPNTPHKLDSTKHDLWDCGGQAHAWNYRRERQEYFCTRCKGVIAKHDLKKATDDV
jgi:hypothetical protein